MDGRYKISVKVGSLVKIEDRLNKDSFISGKVAEILSSSYYDSQGILIKLEDGTEGRIKEIFDKESVKDLSHVEMSSILKEFEQRFRKLIRDVLSSDENWWDTKVQQDVREAVELRLSKGDKLNKTLDKLEYDKIDFLDFDDYQKIITKQDNWKNYFEKIFASKEDFTYKMNVLRSLRNDLQHNRDIDEKNRNRFKIFCDDLFSLMDEFQNNYN